MFSFVMSGKDNRHMKAISDAHILCSRLLYSYNSENKQGNRLCVLNKINLHLNILFIKNIFACKSSHV